MFYISSQNILHRPLALFAHTCKQHVSDPPHVLSRPPMGAPHPPPSTTSSPHIPPRPSSPLTPLPPAVDGSDLLRSVLEGIRGCNLRVSLSPLSIHRPVPRRTLTVTILVLYIDRTAARYEVLGRVQTQNNFIVSAAFSSALTWCSYASPW